MHPKLSRRRTLLWGLTLAAGVFGTLAYGQPPMTPPAGPAKIDSKSGALIVPLGGLVQFEPKGPDLPTDILVTREDVLQVRPDLNNPRILLMTGRQSGITQLVLVFKDKPKVVYDVVVQPDYDLLRNLIRRTVPTANVELTPGIGNVFILSGYVSNPQDADIVARLALSSIGGNTSNRDQRDPGGRGATGPDRRGRGIRRPERDPHPRVRLRRGRARLPVSAASSPAWRRRRSGPTPPAA